MSHSRSRRPSVCATCEVVIEGRPVMHAGLPFCCVGCAVGGPCTCSYDRDQGLDDVTEDAVTNVRYCLDVRALVTTPPAPAPHHGHARILAHE